MMPVSRFSRLSSQTAVSNTPEITAARMYSARNQDPGEDLVLPSHNRPITSAATG